MWTYINLTRNLQMTILKEKTIKIITNARDHFHAVSETLDGEDSFTNREFYLECVAALELLNDDAAIMPSEIFPILHEYADSLKRGGFNCHSRVVTNHLNQH